MLDDQCSVTELKPIYCISIYTLFTSESKNFSEIECFAFEAGLGSQIIEL